MLFRSSSGRAVGLDNMMLRCGRQSPHFSSAANWNETKKYNIHKCPTITLRHQQNGTFQICSSCSLDPEAWLVLNIGMAKCSSSHQPLTSDSFTTPQIWPLCTITYHPHDNRFMALFRDHPGESLPENFWTSWCKKRLTEADTPMVRLGATPSGLTSAHLHHPPFFLQAGCLSCRSTVSKYRRQLQNYDIYGPFSGTTQVSHCQKRTSGLYGARKD